MCVEDREEDREEEEKPREPRASCSEPKLQASPAMLDDADDEPATAANAARGCAGMCVSVYVYVRVIREEEGQKEVVAFVNRQW